MERRITGLEGQFGRIEMLLGSIDQRMRGLDDRVRGLDERVGGLDDRVRGLDDRVRGVDDRLRKLEIDVGELRGRTFTMPSTWAMITTVIGGQVTLAALLLGALKLSGTH